MPHDLLCPQSSEAVNDIYSGGELIVMSADVPTRIAFNWHGFKIVIEPYDFEDGDSDI